MRLLMIPIGFWRLMSRINQRKNMSKVYFFAVVSFVENDAMTEQIEAPIGIAHSIGPPIKFPVAKPRAMWSTIKSAGIVGMSRKR